MLYRLTISVCTVQTQASDRLSITCYRLPLPLKMVESTGSTTKVSKVAVNKPPINTVANGHQQKGKNWVRTDKVKQEKSISYKMFCLGKELLEKDK